MVRRESRRRRVREISRDAAQLRPSRRERLITHRQCRRGKRALPRGKSQRPITVRGRPRRRAETMLKATTGRRTKRAPTVRRTHVRLIRRIRTRVIPTMHVRIGPRVRMHRTTAGRRMLRNRNRPASRNPRVRRVRQSRKSTGNDANKQAPVVEWPGFGSSPGLRYFAANCKGKLRSRRWPLVVGDLLPAVGDVLTTNEQATPKISLQAIAARHVLWLREQHWPSWFRAVHGSTVTAGVVDFSATIFIRDLA